MEIVVEHYHQHISDMYYHTVCWWNSVVSSRPWSETKTKPQLSPARDAAGPQAPAYVSRATVIYPRIIGHSFWNTVYMVLKWGLIGV